MALGNRPSKPMVAGSNPAGIATVSTVFGFIEKSRLHDRLQSAVRRAFRRGRDLRWWIQHRIDPRHRYHVIWTGLEPNYYDIDTLMLHGMFSLLRRYVEGEMGGVEQIEEFNRELRAPSEHSISAGTVEMEAAQADRQGEAVALYQWWTIQRPADVQRIDLLIDLLYGDDRPAGERAETMRAELWALEQKSDREDQEMLHRLIDIRGSLWT